MTNKRIKILHNIALMKEGVLLLFDDDDSAIARNWRNAMKTANVIEERL